MKEKKKLLPLLIVNVILLLMVLIPTIMIGITGISLFGQLVGSSRWIASISFVVDQISFIILGSLSFYLGRVMLRNEEKYDRKFAIAYHVIGIILILTGIGGIALLLLSLYLLYSSFML